MHVGRMCREQSLSRVAQLLRLSWHTVKDLEKQYLQKLVDRVGTPAPRAIGIDEISIRKGHVYRIVVSDLERKRHIWFGGDGRREEDLEMFFAWLGPRKTAKIRLAVMAVKWTIKMPCQFIRWNKKENDQKGAPTAGQATEKPLPRAIYRFSGKGGSGIRLRSRLPSSRSRVIAL